MIRDRLSRFASPRARHAIVEADHAARRPRDVNAAEHDAGASRQPNAEVALVTQEQERRQAIARELNMQLIDRHAV